MSVLITEATSDAVFTIFEHMSGPVTLKIPKICLQTKQLLNRIRILPEYSSWYVPFSSNFNMILTILFFLCLQGWIYTICPYLVILGKSQKHEGILWVDRQWVHLSWHYMELLQMTWVLRRRWYGFCRIATIVHGEFVFPNQRIFLLHNQCLHLCYQNINIECLYLHPLFK